MAERKTKNPQIDFLERVAKTASDRHVPQSVHDWWFDKADEKFRELAQTYINFKGSTIARQAHLDVNDDISLEMGVDQIAEELGNTFNSARSRGITAEEIATQVRARARDLERRSQVPGWASPLTRFTVDILAKKWGLSDRKIQRIRRNLS